MDEEKKIHQREFNRCKIYYGLEAKVRISKIGEKVINSGFCKVNIYDISPGGICMETNLQFPVQEDLILELEFKLGKVTKTYYGYIAWKRPIKTNKTQYGVKFIINEKDRSELFRLINQIMIRRIK